jgi:hypothetical protein
MSLDISLYIPVTTREAVFAHNITHNLGKMADAAGIYRALWRPEEIGITHAKQLIPILTAGLHFMRANKAALVALEPSNKWGNYQGLLELVEKYLRACEEHPQAEVSVCR